MSQKFHANAREVKVSEGSPDESEDMDLLTEVKMYYEGLGLGGKWISFESEPIEATSFIDGMNEVDFDDRQGDFEQQIIDNKLSTNVGNNGNNKCHWEMAFIPVGTGIRVPAEVARQLGYVPPPRYIQPLYLPPVTHAAPPAPAGNLAVRLGADGHFEL
ncbi:hypothetical protein RUND412_002916 [Rhizina undulata]